MGQVLPTSQMFVHTSLQMHAAPPPAWYHWLEQSEFKQQWLPSHAASPKPNIKPTNASAGGGDCSAVTPGRHQSARRPPTKHGRRPMVAFLRPASTSLCISLLRRTTAAAQPQQELLHLPFRIATQALQLRRNSVQSSAHNTRHVEIAVWPVVSGRGTGSHDASWGPLPAGVGCSAAWWL